MARVAEQMIMVPPPTQHQRICYWIVDPRDGVFDAFDLVDGAYESAVRLEGDDVAAVWFGSSRLTIDLTVLFGS